MKQPSLTVIWSTGIAIFAMFFGSGNVVFPLLLGQLTGNQVPYALLGLTITAVGAPLLGLLGAVLFEADCKQFFQRIGIWPGFFLVLSILLLLGPFGVMPRCFTVAYGAIKIYFPNLSMFAFSFIAGLFTYISIVKRKYILPLLGYWLSPLKILTLVTIIAVALWKVGSLASTSYTPTQSILEGLTVGYNTMDLLASLLFSVSIWLLLKERLNLNENDSKEALIPTYIYACLIGGGLLGIIYVGLSFSAALHPEALQGSAPEQVLPNLAIYLLGPKLAVIANFAIVISCLTTVMSLGIAVVDVIYTETIKAMSGRKIKLNYNMLMISTLILTVLFSNLGFATIMKFLDPILSLCYPAIIVFACCNILYKLYGFPYVKLPFYATIIGMMIWKWVM